MSHSPEMLIFNLIQQIQTEIENRISLHPEIKPKLEDCVRRLSDLNLTPEKLELEIAAKPNHEHGLKYAIEAISDPRLLSLKKNQAAEAHICCREDKGYYYKDQTHLGSYVGNNLNCQLVGPDGVAYKTNDVMAGLFYLSPRVFYRDHNHPAPKIYFTLSNRSGWRFGLDDMWSDYPANSLIWNHPWHVHATRVYDEPFFAVFVWTKDIPVPATIVEPNPEILADWAEVEASLKKKGPIRRRGPSWEE